MLYVNPMVSPYAARINVVADDPARRRVALKELEQHFIFTLLQEMRKTIPKGGAFGRGFEGRMQEEMLDDALSSAIAQSGQFGIAKMVEEQLRVAEMQHRLKGSVRSQDLQDTEVRSNPIK